MIDDVIDNHSPGQHAADGAPSCREAVTNNLARRDRIPVAAGIYLRA